MAALCTEAVLYLEIFGKIFFSGQNIRKPKNECRCHSEAFWHIHHSVCWLTRARQFVKIQKAYIPNVLSCMSILKTGEAEYSKSLGN